MSKSSEKINKDSAGEKSGSKGIAYRILIEPVITEASTMAVESNKYVFKVASAADKFQIKAAVEGLYDVKVVSVNTLNVRRKAVSYGRTPGFRSGWKKSIVKLAEGSSIELFKGV